MSGTWAYEAPDVVGTVGDEQASCRAFDAVLVIVQSGVNFGPFDGDIVDGVVDELGNLSFAFNTSSWVNVGTRTPDRMSGTATLNGTIDSTPVWFTGAFSAVSPTP